MPEKVVIDCETGERIRQELTEEEISQLNVELPQEAVDAMKRFDNK